MIHKPVTRRVAKLRTTWWTDGALNDPNVQAGDTEETLNSTDSIPLIIWRMFALKDVLMRMAALFAQAVRYKVTTVRTGLNRYCTT